MPNILRVLLYFIVIFVFVLVFQMVVVYEKKHRHFSEKIIDHKSST